MTNWDYNACEGKVDKGMDIRGVSINGMTVDNAPVTNKIADEAAEVGTVVQPSLTSRRISTGNQFTPFIQGGYVQPAFTRFPKVSHKVAFESAGSIFTVQELLSALTRIPHAGRASAVDIMSWEQHHDPDGESPQSKDAQVAVVEWVE